MRLNAPAKINLNLRILRRLDDGYHLIDSVVVPINLFDVVEIRRLKRAEAPITLRCDDPKLPAAEGNLAYQAAALMLSEARIQHAVHIDIRKRIPIGAGLGGGSSDAAAVLLGLNRLFRLGWSAGKLAGLGRRLGADVPFFVYGRPARVGGKGEVVRPLHGVPRLALVVVYPGFPVETRWAYENVVAKLTRKARNTSITASLNDFGRLAQILTNDLEAVTLPRYPKLSLLKQKLLAEGARGALMTGSGSSIFGIFDSEVMARRAFHRLQKEEESRAYLVHSLS